MKTKAEIRAEMDAIRDKLNEKVANSESRIPDAETMELSQKMDELLNLLNSIED